MASATCRVLLLAALFAAATPAVAGAGGVPDREAAQTLTAANDADTPAGARPGEFQGDNPSYQTLGVLALGVLGLLWVRRHTARL